MIESQALLGCGSAPPTLEGLGAAGTMPSDYLVDGGLTKNDDIEWAHGSPFPKGKSGNPGGRTKQFAQCQRLCREASPDAARRLIELIQSEDERVALMAADKVFERAWGKAKDYDPDKEAPKRAPPFDPSLYTTDELRRMQEVMLMIAQRQGMMPPEEMEQ